MGVREGFAPKRIDKIEIIIEARDENETPEESEESTGSAPGYAKAVRGVMEKATGKWGWCVAVVRARAMDKKGNTVGEGTAYLGNCSYLSAEDFANKSGYLPQMAKEAIEEARDQRGLR